MAKSTSASPDGISIGIDIGGTFTDVVLRTPAASHILKVPTVRAEPGRAVIAALDEIASRLSVPTGAITSFTHGSTIATNAVLERKGARVGLVTTEGFRDILEIGRQIRRQMYDLNLKPETPGWLAPGARRVEVRERIGSAGEVLVPLDEVFARRRNRQAQGRACRGRGGGAAFLVPQSRARATRPRGDRGCHARRAGLALLRGRSGLPRVRAHCRHHLRRLCEADRPPLSRRHGARSRQGRRAGAAAGHAVPRRSRRQRRRAVAASAALPFGTSRRRHWRSGSRPGGRLRQPHHHRRRRHLQRYRADRPRPRACAARD